MQHLLLLTLKYTQELESTHIFKVLKSKLFKLSDLVCYQSFRINGHPTQLLRISMYNFGSPKIGNWVFTKYYDRLVPDSFRIVVDGDVVSAVPPTTNYAHVGTQIVVDSLCNGSIIVDPSFVERRLHTSLNASLRVHQLSGKIIVHL